MQPPRDKTPNKPYGWKYETDTLYGLLFARRRIQETILRIVRAYVAVGFIAGVSALLYAFIDQLEPFLTFEEQLPLLVAATGFATSILAFAYLWLVKSRRSEALRRDRQIIAALAFLDQWRKLEKELGQKEIYSEPSSSFLSPAALERLSSEPGWEPTDRAMLLEAIRFRNELVHGGRTVMAEEFINALVDYIVDFRRRLTNVENDS